MHRNAWKKSDVIRSYLGGIRQLLPLAEQQIEIMMRLIETTQSGVSRVLDIGCGDGIVGRSIRSVYPECTLVFVDYSEPMLEAATAILPPQPPATSYRLADFGEAGWQKDIAPGFDVIASRYAIHHVPHEAKQRLYEDIFEMLNPGGIFINVEHVASRGSLGERLFNDMLIDTIYGQSEEGTTREEVAEAFHNRKDKDDNILAPVEDQCGWLRRIGFVEVDVYLKIAELAVFAGIRPDESGT
ncbi:MAG: class I SAM-dependent methyltransferase [Anaerolineae bacterium]|nr:class I SAM-dependent methyltransferase [Anaerolineae bacterium]